MIRNLVKTILLVLLIQKGTIAQEVKTTFVPMQDGTDLATDIWMPEEGEGPWPAILVRTPYSRKRVKGYGHDFSRHGYVVALQDVRGQYDSEGEFELWINEKEDGYDAVEWLAMQPWCNGKVGMIGGSYGAYTLLAAAVTKPPHLVTIIPKVGMGDPSINHVYPGGVFALKDHVQATHIFAHNYTVNDKHPPLAAGWKNQLDDLPVIVLDKEITGRELKQWREHIQYKPGNTYWESADFLLQLRELDIPVFLIGGWFDFGGIGTKESYLHLIESRNKHIKLLLGPWAHLTLGKSSLGPYDFGENAKLDIDAQTLRWFDYWLKSDNNGIMDEALVQVFATGPNIWMTSETYPLPESKVIKYHLTSSMFLEKEADNINSFSSYTYDPGDPTPSIWYDNSAQYDSLVKNRKDLLVYESEALEDDHMLLGPVSATLYASSSAPDTDWFVYLMELDSSGNLGPLMLRGQVRASYRKPSKGKLLLEKDKVYEYTLDLSHTGYLIPAGNKLRVMISSAGFPRFSRNLNTGMDNETTTEFQLAEQKIYHSIEYPSHISLHVLDMKQ